MGAWGEVSWGQTAAFGGLGRRTIGHRLSLFVRSLSPTVRILPSPAKSLPSPVTVRHDLPQPVNFSSHARRWPGRGKTKAWREGHSMSLRSLKLWHIGIPRRGERRVGWRDQKEGEGHRSPVTVCHIVGDDLKRETCGRAFRRGRRPAPDRTWNGANTGDAPNGGGQWAH